MSSKTIAKKMNELERELADQELSTELVNWRQEDRMPRLFVRDDDAIEVTENLQRLSDLCENWDIPLLLAVIPKYANDDLEDFLRRHQTITPAVHGFSHANYAGEDEKKIELGNHRPVSRVLDELALARAKLSDMFGEGLSGLLVPPWNRIDSRIAADLGELGFSGISGFGWKNAVDAIVRINTHVDIIDWKNGKVGKPMDIVLAELTANLKHARQNNFAPLGILTHHLAHNEQCWQMLEAMFALLNASGNVQWVKADDLVTD